MTTVTEPVTSVPSPPDRLRALLRNSWRQLTSMRTALVLLFLLAIAAVPGSVLPQRDVNIEQVDAYFAEHPRLAPVLDRLGAFEVFASVWFSAIYLLLFTSLVGCIVPRLRDHWRALRAAPPDAPKRLDRLPQHAVVSAPPTGIDSAAIAGLLMRRRWRVTVRENRICAEKGYLKETGNLLFHVSLLTMLVGVALGSWYGWHGNRLLVAGADNAFCNLRQQYSESALGPRVDDRDLPPFCLQLTDFQARFLPDGQPEFYNAEVLVDEAGGAARPASFSVNSPLRLDGANVYLLGHGYAPVIRYTDRNGRAQTSVAPFLSTDGMLTSEGVADFPDVNVDPKTGARNPDLQVAFEGLYLPTAPADPPFVRSVHPAERSPALMIFAYRGNLGKDAGIPGSVYRLDQRQVKVGKLRQVGDAKLLRPGEKWVLDDGTAVEFLGTRPYITLSVRHDPGEYVKLGSAVTMVIGLMLSLFGHRRRVWFRLVPADAGPPGAGAGGRSGATADGSPGPASAQTDRPTTSGSSVIEAGGLPRTDYAGFTDEFDRLVAALSASNHGVPEGNDD